MGMSNARNDLVRLASRAGTRLPSARAGYDHDMAKTPKQDLARPQQKDIFSRVQDIGAEMLNKLPDVPGGAKVMEMLNESKARLDEMQRKLRGLDALEQRVAKLERELAKKSSTSKSMTAGKGTTSARKPALAEEPPA